MPSFYIPLSGLNADSTALNTIANNLSNMNTTAFKSGDTEFSDLFYQQIGSTGSGDKIQVGGGVRVAANHTDFTQGTFNTSGTSSSDVALNGNGFFVVNGGGVNLLTRNGTFSQNASGHLVTADGLSVMGYPAVNGVVNTGAQVAPISVPAVGQVQQPLATTQFGMTANLDSTAAIGASVPGQVQVFDSLGQSYEATVTYTKTATNQWSYSVSLPDNLTPAPIAAPAAATLPVPSAAGAATTVTIPAVAPAATATPYTATLTPTSSVSGLNTTYNYNFGTAGTVDATTSLTIGGVPLAIPGGGESLAALQGQITALAQAGVSASVNGSVLSITAPTAVATMMAAASTVVGDIAAKTTTFQFNTGGTVDPTTNLTITGQTVDGVSATIAAPQVVAGESLTTYANALTAALTAKGITNVAVNANTGTGQLSIVGADVTTANAVNQSLAASTTDYGFGSSSTVDTTTNLTITGQTATGASATMVAPNITAGESVARYAADINTNLGLKGIVGVKAYAVGGQLQIVGANSTIAGNVSQDLTATTTTYNFGSAGGTVATVNPGTNLAITGRTVAGATATIVAPTVTSGETVALYTSALNTALSNAGITGVAVSSTAGGQLSIVGSNITTSGSVIQDPVASANAAGVMSFDSSGNLVSPAVNVAGITFGGLSDGAAGMNMTWDILGSSGKPTISQTDATSTTSAAPQNGYASGSYQGFAIGSDGTVTASYSNGQTEAVGQLALANVTNLEGLSLQGNGIYATTLASGDASIGISGTNGLATIQDSALEQSNVNISAEFSNLIIAQRGFEANSKAITTFDTITQETINMIH